ncbi:MAG: hypothetical protein Kow0027_28110 [Saprospiraceae bacterium]
MSNGLTLGALKNLTFAQYSIQNTIKFIACMKKLLFSLLLLVSMGSMGWSQLNMTLLDQIDYTQNTNDIWGWFDPVDSTEYALVGTTTGVSIVSLADPTDVQEVAFIPGPNSTWRDLKTWGNFVYVTNESSDGLLVIDMTNHPNNITYTYWAPDLPGLGVLSSCHNLYIDEFGVCYLAGCNLNGGGILFVDVATTPGNPQFIAAGPPVYNHDVFARDNIMYSSEIYAGELGIYDVSDKLNVVKLAEQQTPYSFTHNAWLNDAGDVVFTTDEKANAPVAAYDISDLNNIVELDQFRPIATIGENVIPHNVHVWEDWLIISYYTDGGIIVDASRPSNLIEVGNWDTFLGGNGGFSGAWGAYPFLPSGLVLLTDIGNGLYVCGANYVRACWLEGTVTDSQTGLPILGADVHIESSQANAASTKSDGHYETGQALAGTFDVTFSATGYETKVVEATLENGVLTILDVELDPVSSYTITGQAVKATDGSPVPGAQVFLSSPMGDFSAVADANGNFTFPGVFTGNYELFAGAWGYLHKHIANFQVGAGTPQPVIITLNKGYQDDFILDLGWTESHTASTGWWVRDVPILTTNGGQPVNPGEDVPDDYGNMCYMTGNGGGGAGNDDVDNGVVTLYSPIMDLSNYSQPVLSYRSWFVNTGGNGNPNDTLKVYVSNGTDMVLLEAISQSNPAWNPTSEFNLLDYISLTDQMQVIFETSDLPGTGHLVEAAVDQFLVEDVSPYPVFSASVTAGCQPLTVTFTDNSDSTATWNWTFAGGEPATSTEQNPTVIFNNPGEFTVMLEVVTNDGNTYTITRPDLIQVQAAPTAGFDYIVLGGEVSFTNTSAYGQSFEWDFGDGSPVSTATEPVHNYDDPGIYTVSLTVTNDCGTAILEQDVLILQVAPEAGFSTSATSGCAPLTVEFTDTSMGNPNTWEWQFPGGEPATSTEQNPTVVYNEAGTYTVILTVSNDVGESQVIQSQFIEVEAEPVAAFEAVADLGEVTFTNNSQNGLTYEWDFGDGSTSNEENPVHTYTTAGEFEVSLTVTNDCGFAVASQTVTIVLTATNELDPAAYTLDASPNPFGDELRVNYSIEPGFGEATLQLYDALGRVVFTTPLEQANGTISLTRQIPEKGIYLLRLTVDGQSGSALRVARL